MATKLQSLLSGDEPAGPGQQFLGASPDHDQYEPDGGPHRPEHRRQRSGLYAARPLAGRDHVQRKRDESVPVKRWHDASDHHQLHVRLYPYAHAEPGERLSLRPEFLQYRDAESVRQSADRPAPERIWESRASTEIHCSTTRAFRTSRSRGSTGLRNGSTNWYQNDSTFQISEQFSWSHGSHNIMAGMEFRRLATGRAAVNSARGLFTFNGTLTGYAPADFILGMPQIFTTPGPEVRGRSGGMARWLLRA